MRRFEDKFLTRRDLLRIGGVTMAGQHLLPPFTSNVMAAGDATPRGSARFCIFVMLQGGQSHVDCWDLKEGPWTPPDFDVRTIGPGIKWPMSLYPNMAARLEKFTLVRSLAARESQHGPGQYCLQTAHRYNAALASEIPPIGAVVASEYASRRRPADVLPPYVALNTFPHLGLARSGFLPPAFGPFPLNTVSDLPVLAAFEEERRQFQRPRERLNRFTGRLGADLSLERKIRRDDNNHREGTAGPPPDQRTANVFLLRDSERERYGKTVTGDAFLLARNMVVADAGTHFIFLTQEGWDHHADIYAGENHYRLSRELDLCLSNLLDDLEASKRPDGRSALDETLVIAIGEFGRTPGALSNIAGRDHYPYAFTGCFAGGGVKPGQIIGKTDDQGARIVDYGWSQDRSVQMEDIAATIYSAMGIDWTKRVEATSSGPAFQYIDASSTPLLASREVSELFS